MENPYLAPALLTAVLGVLGYYVVPGLYRLARHAWDQHHIVVECPYCGRRFASKPRYFDHFHSRRDDLGRNLPALCSR